MISDRKTDRVSTALRQMQQVIDRYVRCSLNGDLYEKAIDCLSQLRNAAVTEDEAPTFNKFMEKLKDTYATGPHKEFFQMMRKGKLSLITRDESEISSVVTKDEADSFFSLHNIKPVQSAPVVPKKKDDEDYDLLD